MESPSAPTATIIGAGLAGLSVAIALRRAGWLVTLYERSHFTNEIGAAITVNPPAVRAFTAWGFDFAKAKPSRNDQMIIRKADDLVVIGDEQYGDLETRFGFSSLFFHRVDLHKGLLDVAEGAGEGKPAKVVLGKKVVSVDVERGITTFESGEELDSDLVVVADGAHSTLNSIFRDEAIDAVPTGRSIFRFLIPMERIKNDPHVSEFYKDGKAGFMINLDLKDDVLFMNYPCREDSLINCALVHATRKDQDESDVWNSQASVARALETLHNCHPSVKRYVELCEDEDIKVHHAMKRPPLNSFVKGRACIVGDAAHIMLPTHAAGLTVAVESAAALEPIMRGVKPGDVDAIKQRLDVWDKLRNPRCNFVMIHSNAGPGGLNVPGTEQAIRQYYRGPLPPKEAGLWTEKSRDVFLDCDAVAEAEQAMRQAGMA